MSQKYKKIGVTTQGYRGERLVLQERVIEGFTSPEFTTSEFRLEEDSEQTIYLTNANTQSGYYLVLPNATELWNNWRTTIINNSSYPISVYYYAPEGTNTANLNLVKDITAGSMITLILLDNTSEQGTWTTLRTSETASADTTEKYVSNVYDTFNISYEQLQEAATYYAYKPTTGSDLYTTDNPIQLNSVLYNSNLQPLNPQVPFTINEQEWILENITNNNCGTEEPGIYQGGANCNLTTITTPTLSTASNWEIKLKYTYNGGGSYQTVLGSSSQILMDAPFINIEGGIVYIYLASTAGLNWNLVSRFDTGLRVTNTTYYFKLSYDSNNGYSFYYSTTDFITGTTVTVTSSTTAVYCNAPISFLNNGTYSDTWYSGGFIDLSETSITIDGTETTFGYITLPSFTTHMGSGDTTIDTIYTYHEEDNIMPSLSNTIINLSKIPSAGTVRSIYFKPTEQFVGSSEFKVSIGTEDNTGLFFNEVDITGAVSDTNFNKDLFERMLSTSSDIQLIAKFEGTNINTLTSGSLQIVVERTKLIDPTILKNAIVTTQIPIGTILNYAFDDTPVGYVRLNGTIFPDANNTIPQFVEYLTKVNNRLVDEKLIVTSDVWEQEFNTYGSCGKFAWYNSGLRFPAVNCFIKGLSSVSQLSKLTEAGLPNIIGTYATEDLTNDASVPTTTGAFYAEHSGRRDAKNGSGNGYLIGFDASRCSLIYGKSKTVTPTNIQFPYIISVANKVQANSQIDYDKLVASTVDKADRDLSNINWPTSGIRKLVEVYNDGTNWYKVFKEYDPSTGIFIGNWCEQGGLQYCSSNSSPTVTFLKPFINANYHANVTLITAINDPYVVCPVNLTSISMQIRNTMSVNLNTLWEVKGYIS